MVREFDVDGLQVPPHSDIAERSVIGGVLSTPTVIGDLDDLNPGNFYISRHRQIYQAIRDIDASGGTPDMITVSDRLSDIGAMEEIGFDYIVALCRDTPSISNIRQYAKIVQDKAIERSMVHAANEIIDTVFNEDAKTEEKLASAQTAIMTLETQEIESAAHVDPLLKDAIALIDERYNSDGKLTGMATGFNSYDYRLNGMEDGDLILISGRPSMGKTTLAMNIAMNVAMGGDHVVVFSLEMPNHQLMNRMLSDVSSIPFNTIRSGNMREEDWPKLSSGVSKLKGIPLYIDDRGGLTPAQMRSTARRIHRKNKVRLVVVDYIQLARVHGVDNKTLEVGEISRSLKQLAKELNCPVIALSQLNRDCEKRPDKRPYSSDLRDSGSLEQDADIITFMYRDVVYNENTKDPRVAEMITRKFRNGEIGTDYVVSELEYCRFRNMVNEYTPPKEEEPEEFRYEG